MTCGGRVRGKLDRGGVREELFGGVVHEGLSRSGVPDGFRDTGRIS